MVVNIDYKKTGILILENIKNLNCSISYLSKEIGIDDLTFRDYIEGNRKITLDYLISICNLLNISLDDVLVYETKNFWTTRSF